MHAAIRRSLIAWFAAARRRGVRRPVQWNNVRRQFLGDTLTGPIGFIANDMLRQHAVVRAIVALASEYCFSRVTRIEYAPHIAQAATGRSHDVFDRRRIL